MQQTTTKSPQKSPSDYEKVISNGVESALCAISLKHFATKHIWIQNQNTQKIEKWQPWPYLLDLIDIIQEYDLNDILKASKLGISWLIVIITLHLAMHGENVKGIMISQGQPEAEDLLPQVAFIISS